MPRAKKRKTSAGPSGARHTQPRSTHSLTSEQIRLILEEEEDSDLETQPLSEGDESDHEEEPEVVTHYADIDGGAPEDSDLMEADGSAPRGAGGDAAAVGADSDSDSSDEDEVGPHRPAVNLIRAKRRLWSLSSREHAPEDLGAHEQ